MFITGFLVGFFLFAILLFMSKTNPAEDEAKQIRREAKIYRDMIIKNAQSECEKILRKSEKEADKILKNRVQLTIDSETHLKEFQDMKQPHFEKII